MGSQARTEVKMDPFPIAQLQTYCSSRQYLEASSKASNVLKVVDDLCGLHATSTVTPYLSLFSRMKRFEPKMLDWELGEGGGLVRIRGIRGTLFVMPRSRAALVRNALGRQTEPTRKWYSLRGMRRQEFSELRSLVLDALKRRSLSI